MSAMVERGDALAELVNFVAGAFTRHELESFVRRLSNGSQLVLELPSPPASPVQVADALVLAVQRLGLLDRDFFLALVRERRLRQDEIELIMLNYLPGPKPRIQLGEGVELCNGRFVLTDLRDSGGFGMLWKARDTLLKETVAIKVLSRELSETEYAWRRTMFIRGAQRMAAIKHAHIARVLIPHISEKGYDFCVLEYIDGRSLHAEVRAKSFVLINEIVMALLDIGAGLADVHAAGAIHGDVSPKNILVKRINGRAHARLVDFDLVCASDDRLLTMSATGMPGTDPYAAPEWKAREGKVDGRVDVFGLGMTAVYAFYGSALPPSLNDPDAMDPTRFIDRKLNCDPAIKSVLKRACSHDRNDRYATMMDLCIALKRAVTKAARSSNLPSDREDPQLPPEPPPRASAVPAPSLQRSPHSALNTKVSLALLSVLMLISVVIAVWWLAGHRDPVPRLEDETSAAQQSFSEGSGSPIQSDPASTSGEYMETNPAVVSGSTFSFSTGPASTESTSADVLSRPGTKDLPVEQVKRVKSKFVSKRALEALLERKLAQCGSDVMEEVVKLEIFIGASGNISELSILDGGGSAPIGVLDCVSKKLASLRFDNLRYGKSGQFVLHIDLPVVD